MPLRRPLAALAAIVFAGAVFAAFLIVSPAFAQATRPLYGESGTIATGGTAQNLFTGVMPVMGWEVCNPDTSDLWVSDLGTAAAAAAGSYRVPANGGCYITPRTGQPNALGVVSLVGATTGQKYTARKW